MREPLFAQKWLSVYFGITPACAGTTYADLSARIICKDHPRVCGNHGRKACPACLLLGSPPRVREPLTVCSSQRIRLGITPACAGTTYSPPHTSRHFRDHPRVCGNHIVPEIWALSMLGSPPRVREPRRDRAKRSSDGRITPACAGTTHHV